MVEVFGIVHGSLGPRLRATLKTNGVPQNLTGATVTLYAERRQSGLIWLNGVSVAILAPATDGVVEYSFVAGDWATLDADLVRLGDGFYRGQWQVANLTPTPVRFPTEHPGYFGINVLPKVA